MRFSKVYSAQPHNLGGHVVEVEVDISRGLHAFAIVGMASKSVDEARDRVSSAIKNTGYESPKSKNEKLVISLAPAELKKEGAYHDLAIALGYLLSSEEIHFDPEKTLFVGELSLDGSIKSVLGILPIVQGAVSEGFTQIFVPQENAEEAALVDGIDIYAVGHVREVIRHFDPKEESFVLSPCTTTNIPDYVDRYITDFKDVRGQSMAKRGLEIAAAGGHNVCMYGPPGTGKTMLARAFNSILPPLNHDHALEVVGIHSICGNPRGLDIMSEPPLRTPHHTASYVSLVGGGAYIKPGEITLAHRGILFLDEFPEFDKRVLESLRQPLEDRVISISRAKGSVIFPANFILVAAMNPCPCGFYGAEHRNCTCSPYDIIRYQKKISGPIVDRIDIWLPVEHVDYDNLIGDHSTEESSIEIKKRVLKAREFQKNRRGNNELNASLSSRTVQSEVLSSEVKKILNQSAQKMQLSPRAYHRVIKLARTIADLDTSTYIQVPHILEALQYRPQLFQ